VETDTIANEVVPSFRACQSAKWLHSLNSQPVYSPQPLPEFKLSSQDKFPTSQAQHNFPFKALPGTQAQEPEMVSGDVVVSHHG
jgi:hypothetical protein